MYRSMAGADCGGAWAGGGGRGGAGEGGGEDNGGACAGALERTVEDAAARAWVEGRTEAAAEDDGSGGGRRRRDLAAWRRRDAKCEKWLSPQLG